MTTAPLVANNLPRVISHVLASAFIVLFLYAQIFIVVATLALRLPNNWISMDRGRNHTVNIHVALPYPSPVPVLEIPLPEVIFHTLNTGGVFNDKATINLEMAVFGQPKGAPIDSTWVNVPDFRRYFPYRSEGELWVRLEMGSPKALAQMGVLDSDAQIEGYKSLARKFIACYNRDHPDHQLERMAIYMVWWRHSDTDYNEFRKQAQFEMVYTDRQWR